MRDGVQTDLPGTAKIPVPMGLSKHQNEKLKWQGIKLKHQFEAARWVMSARLLFPV